MSGLDKLIARRRRPEQEAPVTGQAPADLLEVPYDPAVHGPEANGNGHAPANGSGHAPANGHDGGHGPVTGPAPVNGHARDGAAATVETAAVPTEDPPASEPAAVEAAEAATTAPTEATTTAPGAAEPVRPNLRQRGRVRRRARYLRRLRELQLRDIGGLAVELHRFNRRRQDLIDLKVAAAADTAEELRALERLLAENRPVGELRQAGIGGACARCGAIHGSLDRFCSACGTALGEAPGLEERADG